MKNSISSKPTDHDTRPGSRRRRFRRSEIGGPGRAAEREGATGQGTVLVLAGAMLALAGCVADLDAGAGDVGVRRGALLADGELTLSARALTPSATGVEAVWRQTRVLASSKPPAPMSWSVGAVTDGAPVTGSLREYADANGDVVEAEIRDAADDPRCYPNGIDVVDSAGSPVLELLGGHLYHPGSSAPSYSFEVDSVHGPEGRIIATSSDQNLTSGFRRLLIGAVLDGACGLPAALLDSDTTGPHPVQCGSCTGNCTYLSGFSRLGGTEVAGEGQTPGQCFADIEAACAAVGQWPERASCSP